MTTPEQRNRGDLRSLCDHLPPRAMLEVIAAACDANAAANPRTPLGTIASINGNLIRVAIAGMLAVPGVGVARTGVYAPPGGLVPGEGVDGAGGVVGAGT